jgi:preprotein translocase subunit SecE
MAAESGKKAKRRVKNPETFREKVIKASDESQKPNKSDRLKSGGSTAAKPFRAAGRSLDKLFSTKALKWLRKPLSLLGKIVFPVYFRNSWKELKQVTWPTRRESFRLTFAVLVFAIVFGLAIAGVDYGLDKLFKDILLK